MDDDTLDSVLSAVDGPPNGVDGASRLVVACSTSGRDHDASLWPTGPDRTAAVVTTLGNQVWDHGGGTLSLTGDVSHLLAACDLETVVVVGHTECRVLADAYDSYVGSGPDAAPAVGSRLEPLVSLVADAVDARVLEDSTAPRAARYRLVEYNVVRQARFLADRLTGKPRVLGVVLDEDGAYSSFPGQYYVVTVDGATGREAVRARLPARWTGRAASLLY